MVNVWHDISAGKNVPEEVRVVVEIPKGERNKYELEKETGLIILDRVLYSPFRYPFNYGFIPKSYCEDNDPADVMILMHDPVPAGSIVEVRPIALLGMVDSGEQDNKILAVPSKDPRFDHVKDLKDVSPHILKEIEHFFNHYKDLQGKKVETTGWTGTEQAKQEVMRSLKLYGEKFGQK
jgi:inorganic pyrophosphatase